MIALRSRHISVLPLALFFALIAAATLKSDDSAKVVSPVVVAPADLRLEHDGKEITVLIKITDTQLIGGDREGEFPHVKLHHKGMKEAPYLTIYAKGELADLLHRFAYVSPDDKFVGRSIKASGIVKIQTGADQIPVYILELREWKKFQILPETGTK